MKKAKDLPVDPNYEAWNYMHSMVEAGFIVFLHVQKIEEGSAKYWELKNKHNEHVDVMRRMYRRFREEQGQSPA